MEQNWRRKGEKGESEVFGKPRFRRGSSYLNSVHFVHTVLGRRSAPIAYRCNHKAHTSFSVAATTADGPVVVLPAVPVAFFCSISALFCS